MRNKHFALIGPRRCDLSGRPWGFLFIWKPRDNPSRFSPLTNRTFGFFLPSPFGNQKYEAMCLLDSMERIEGAKRSLQFSFDRLLVENSGSKISKDRMFIDRRSDLSGNPIQVLRQIELAA